jgi:hypothetical protein
MSLSARPCHKAMTDWAAKKRPPRIAPQPKIRLASTNARANPLRCWLDIPPPGAKKFAMRHALPPNLYIDRLSAVSRCRS